MSDNKSATTEVALHDMRRRCCSCTFSCDGSGKFEYVHSAVVIGTGDVAVRFSVTVRLTFDDEYVQAESIGTPQPAREAMLPQPARKKKLLGSSRLVSLCV